MSLNVNSTIITGVGVVGIAPAHTPPPNPYAFDPLDPTTFDPAWYWLHVSRENLPETEKDGGDSDQKGSWWNDAIDVTYETEKNNLTVSSIEINQTTLEAAWPNGRRTAMGGWAIQGQVQSARKAVFIYAFSTRGAITAQYGAAWDARVGDMPKFATDDYFEVQIAGTLLGASKAVETPGATEAEMRIGEKFIIYPPIPLTDVVAAG